MKICQQQDEGYTWQSEKMVAPANQKKKKKEPKASIFEMSKKQLLNAKYITD